MMSVGDTVNVASRCESSGVNGKLNVSEGMKIVSTSISRPNLVARSWRRTRALCQCSLFIGADWILVREEVRARAVLDFLSPPTV